VRLGISAGTICPYTGRPASEDSFLCDGCPTSACLNRFGKWILRMRWRASGLQPVQILGVIFIAFGPLIFIADTRPGYEYVPGALASLLMIPIGLFLFIMGHYAYLLGGRRR